MVEEYRAPGAPPREPEEEQPPAGGPHKYRNYFHGAPVTGPGSHVPLQIPEEWADDLGRHLEACGFFTRDELLLRAGPSGILRPADLPAPRLRQDPPPAGPRTWMNPGPWVPADAPSPGVARPEPPDLSSLSDEAAAVIEAENEAITEALRQRAVQKARLREADPGVSET